MVQSFCFVGDPGSCKLDMLNNIRDAGLEPVRVEASGEAIADLCNERPMAIAIGPEVEKSLADQKVEDPEFWQWKEAMTGRYDVDLRPFLDLVR